MRSGTGNPVNGMGRWWSLAHRRALTGAAALGLPSATAGPDLGVTDAAEIESTLEAVDVDRRDFARRLALRLQPLVQRGVPPRVIEAAPVPRAARLRFADGTTVLVQATAPGELGALALTMRHGSLKPARCTTDPDGSAHLLLSCSGEHRRLSLHVVGLDQPD
jgi:hypothetical protein